MRLKTRGTITVLIITVMLLSGCGLLTPPPQEVAKATAIPAGVSAAPNQENGEEALPVVTQDPNILTDFWKADLDKDVYHILLLGTDLDSPESAGSMYGHNDTTMILQINRTNKTMKLVSFMRDMMVDIGNKKNKRLTDANMYNGPEGVKKLLKSYFGVEIDYYVSVSFVAFEQIMFILGDIYINIQEYEVPALRLLESAVSVDGESIKGTNEISEAGINKVNGYQALDYARDRHTEAVDEFGNIVYGDTARNYRQRQVITKAWEKVKTLNAVAVPPGVFTALVYADCDMPTGEVIALITEMMESGPVMETLAIPQEGAKWGVYEHEDLEIFETITEIKARYDREKAAYDSQAPTPTTDADGNPIPVEYEDFVSFETWQKDAYGASKVAWNQNRSKRAITDFFS